MADPTTTEEIVKTSTRSAVLSVLMMVAGVLAVCLPVLAHVAVAVVVGWLLVFCAILHLAYSWRASGDGAVLWEVILAFVYEAVGVYLIANPVVSVAPLTLALAMCLVVEGILEFVLASQLHPEPGSGWLFLDGILTLVLALLIWSNWPWPAGATWKLGLLVGLSMVLSGLTRLMISLAARKTVE